MIQESKVPVKKPLVFSGSLGLIWLGVKESKAYFHIIGPFLEQSLSRDTISKAIGNSPQLIGAVAESKKLSIPFWPIR